MRMVSNKYPAFDGIRWLLQGKAHEVIEDGQHQTMTMIERDHTAMCQTR